MDVRNRLRTSLDDEPSFPVVDGRLRTPATKHRRTFNPLVTPFEREAPARRLLPRGEKQLDRFVLIRSWCVLIKLAFWGF